MTLLKRFILMLQFLTTIPVPFRLNVKDEDFGKGLVFAPLIGLILGGILAAFYLALSYVFPISINVVLIMILYIVLTGGLHLDGLGDTFDGLFSNRSKERILEIMKDSRVGTNAVIAIVCVIVLDIVVLVNINSAYLPQVLLLMPPAGRIASLMGAGISNYVRKEGGLGKSFIDFCGVKEVVIGIVVSLIIFSLCGLNGIYIFITSVITAFLLVKLLSRKLNGVTGDILGAVCELNQSVFLIAAYIGIRYLI